MIKTVLFVFLYLTCTFSAKAQEKKIDWDCPYIAYLKHHWLKSDSAKGQFILNTPLTDMSKYSRKVFQESDHTCDVGLSPEQVIIVLGTPTKIDSVGNNRPKPFRYVYLIDTKNSSEQKYWKLEAFFSAKACTVGILFDTPGVDIQDRMSPR